MKQTAPDLGSRIGCSTITFKDQSLTGALDRIQAHGLHSVDLGIVPLHCRHLDPFSWTERDVSHLAEQLAQRNLRVSTLNVSVNGLALRHEDEATDFIRSSLRIAGQLGAYGLTLQPGPPAPADNWLDAAKRAATRFRDLASVAEQAGTRLTIEAPHTRTLAIDYTQAARLFELIGDPRIGCTFDTSHAQLNDPRPLVDGIAAVGAEIVHVHLRDAIGRWFSATPGKGICDYGPFFSKLAEGGYTGDLNFELEYGHRPTAFVEHELEFAREYVQLTLGGAQMPNKFRLWKSRRRQLGEIVRRTLANPKGLITSNPTLMARLKPLARFLRNNVPYPYKQFEAGWHLRWRTGRPSGIPVNASQLSPIQTGATTAKRVAVLGCGNIGGNMHAPALAGVASAELVGVCDVDREAADALARRMGCPAYYSIPDLLRHARPDLVANCTKEWIHHPTTMELLENGVDVFCEKIMAEEIHKGEEMVRYAAQQGRVLGVNYNYRFLPGILKIKEIKDSGELGELCILRFLAHSWVWHHALDLVEFLGGQITSVSGLIREDPPERDFRPWRRFAAEVPYQPGIYGLALLKTEENVGTTITSSGLWNPFGCLFNLDAVFRRGVVSLSSVSTKDAVGRLTADVQVPALQRSAASNKGKTGYGITFQRSIQSFMDAYLDGRPVPTNGEHGLRIMRLERAIKESMKSPSNTPFES